MVGSCCVRPERMVADQCWLLRLKSAVQWVTSSQGHGSGAVMVAVCHRPDVATGKKPAHTAASRPSNGLALVALLLRQSLWLP